MSAYIPEYANFKFILSPFGSVMQSIEHSRSLNSVYN
uniref:DUF4422 domain-containing protein n=1 Tax=Heterorhabditis bacteriophora TaxID=37862 RepID=A0A1I7WQV3_HETBA